MLCKIYYVRDLLKKIECSVYMSHSINLLNHVCQKPQKHCEGFVEKSHSLGACYVPQARLSVPRTLFSVGVTVPTVQGRNLVYGGDVTVPDPSHLDICWHFLDTDLNQSPPRHMKFTSKLLFLYFWVEFYRWKKKHKSRHKRVNNAFGHLLRENRELKLWVVIWSASGVGVANGERLCSSPPSTRTTVRPPRPSLKHEVPWSWAAIALCL